MDEADRPATEAGIPVEVVETRSAVHQQAEHLHRRLRVVAEQIAESEDTLARVYEESARLRPHAADRLREGARRARDYAERERHAARSGDFGGPPPP